MASSILALAILAVTGSGADGQYFGRNKVQYDHFDFRVLPTRHFDLHFYAAESVAAADAGRMAERWYHRHFALLKQPFDRNPLILYADQPDFQQSNVIEGLIGQETGGVTEGMRDRVIMPFTGSYAEADHVLGHELVHVFQYRIAQSASRGITSVEQVPLWLIEGMAEYLSLGRDDPNTAMWLRDALRRDDLPTIRQLTTDPRYFPYRYGEALWAYIGGVWGDDAVNRVYRAAVGEGWENALKSVLHISSDSLSKRWHAAIREQFGNLADRTAPDRVGRAVIAAAHENEQNVSPVVSPDGRYVAFFSSRGVFGIDLYLAEAATGRVVRQLTSVTRDRHFDALSFISSAGSWSPDSRRLAFVVFAEGSNAIEIVDVESERTERSIRVPGVGAIADPAWSPDGERIAFAGLKGGISDLYIVDLRTGKATQLTNDREADLQPSWSPDGRTLAFVTDRGTATDFERLTFGPMGLALMDVATREIRPLPCTGSGKAINPQFTPDGEGLYFVSDEDGVSDVYRLTLETEELRRVTRVATGVSGITALSPALSVARQTGELLFSVFDRQGFGIRALAAREAIGTPAAPGAPGTSAALLPPASALATSLVSRALGDPAEGLPPVQAAASRSYAPRLSLDYIGGPSIGVSFGGGYGTALGGGIALGFADMLGNHFLSTVISAPGNIKDISADAIYLDRSRRWNWGVEAYHIPMVSVFASYAGGLIDVGGGQVPGTIYTQQLQRVYFDDLQFLTQYPLSTTRRLEFSAGAQRASFGTEVDSLFVVGGVVLREAVSRPSGAPALNFATASAAYVDDHSFFGFTSPVAGGRYRLQAAPFAGSLNFQTLLADYRRYFFLRPFTIAVRGVHFGRYGADAGDARLQPLFVGQPTFIRGYDAASFDPSECSVGPRASDFCPQFSRLSGSRIAVANAELRVPLFGTERFGLFAVPFLPTEIAPFLDAGVAWSAGDGASLRFDQNTPDRVPVFSVGVTSRFNLFGAMVLEVFWVHPYQRLGRGNQIGFQLLPGW